MVLQYFKNTKQLLPRFHEIAKLPLLESTKKEIQPVLIAQNQFFSAQNSMLRDRKEGKRIQLYLERAVLDSSNRSWKKQYNLISLANRMCIPTSWILIFSQTIQTQNVFFDFTYWILDPLRTLVFTMLPICFPACYPWFLPKLCSKTQRKSNRFTGLKCNIVETNPAITGKNKPVMWDPINIKSVLSTLSQFQEAGLEKKSVQ